MNVTGHANHQVKANAHIHEDVHVVVDVPEHVAVNHDFDLKQTRTNETHHEHHTRTRQETPHQVTRKKKHRRQQTRNLTQTYTNNCYLQNMQENIQTYTYTFT